MKTKDKKYLFFLPIIFILLLFIPVLFGDIAPERINGSINSLPETIRRIYLFFLLLSTLIWCVTFYYIPTGLYIVILIVYTGLSWTWILKKKEGDRIFFVAWFVLGIVSILLYWRLSPVFCEMIHG